MTMESVEVFRKWEEYRNSHAKIDDYVNERGDLVRRHEKLKCKQLILKNLTFVLLSHKPFHNQVFSSFTPKEEES